VSRIRTTGRRECTSSRTPSPLACSEVPSRGEQELENNRQQPPSLREVGAPQWPHPGRNSLVSSGLPKKYSKVYTVQYLFGFPPFYIYSTVHIYIYVCVCMHICVQYSICVYTCIYIYTVYIQYIYICTVQYIYSLFSTHRVQTSAYVLYIYVYTVYIQYMYSTVVLYTSAHSIHPTDYSICNTHMSTVFDSTDTHAPVHLPSNT
jgi:hypothetical protein